MSDGDSNIKYRRLDREVFKAFLQNKYSEAIGEKILLYIEATY